jgi:non-specific serine/threonine protein kinase
MVTSLPAPLTSFIGREREIAEVRRLLAGTRLLSLTGAGGVGKSRLALQVAAAVSGEYAGGARLVELAALADPALVPSTVAAALGVQEEPGRPPLATLSDHLRPRSLLLVLDNCEHLAESCAVLAEALLRDCPRLQILVTSRQALALTGETVWQVPPLAVPSPEGLAAGGQDASTGGNWGPERVERNAVGDQGDAVRLFLERAAAANPGISLTERSIAAAVEICRRLDGIPLAIELAAARVRTLTPEQIAERLDDRFRLLTTGSRTAPPRHQTLRATLDWSHDLLSEREVVLLRRLAVFAGSWPLEAAEQICGNRQRQEAARAATEPQLLPQPLPDSYLPLDPGEVLDLLTALVEKSLVLAEQADGTTRFRLMETVRQYARERLEASGEGACARSAHAEYYLALAENAQREMQGPAWEVALDRLEAAHDNLRAALRWWFECDVALGLRLGAALWQFWEARGHLTEGLERLTVLLSTAGARAAPPVRAEALTGRAYLASMRGDLAAARRSFQECLTTSRAIDDRRGIAHALNGLGIIAGYHGALDEARALQEQSLAIMRDLNDRRGSTRVLASHGLLLEHLGDLDAASARHEECLALARDFGDRRRIALSLNGLGEVAAFQGDFGSARTLHEEALAINRELGDPGNIAATLAALGRVLVETGDYDGAHRLFGESLALMQRLGARRVVARCLEGLAAVASARREPLDAARLFGAAEAAREAFGTPVFAPYRPWFDRDVAAARAQLDPETFAAAWAEGGTMPLDEAITYALAGDQSSETVGDAAPDGEEIPLSTREREVAVLVAQGLTNRQIADELVVATSTVDRHVVHILRKLDFGNRAQVAAWVVERGLAGAAR